MNKLQLNDIGTTFVLTIVEGSTADPCVLVPVNISSATAMTLEFGKPDGTTISRAAVLDSDGTDGKLKYVTVAGDIYQVGRWQVQAAATLGGWIGRSDIHQFLVAANVA